MPLAPPTAQVAQMMKSCRRRPVWICGKQLADPITRDRFAGYVAEGGEDAEDAELAQAAADI